MNTRTLNLNMIYGSCPKNLVNCCKSLEEPPDYGNCNSDSYFMLGLLMARSDNGSLMG